jgi:hypothetical protein
VALDVLADCRDAGIPPEHAPDFLLHWYGIPAVHCYVKRLLREDFAAFGAYALRGWTYESYARLKSLWERSHSPGVALPTDWADLSPHVAVPAVEAGMSLSETTAMVSDGSWDLDAVRTLIALAA